MRGKLTTFVDMTQDQLNHVKQVLAEFRSSKVGKIKGDHRLETAEQQGTPFETVKQWYPIYLAYGAKHLSKHIGIGPKQILDHFKKYNLTLRGRCDEPNQNRAGYYLKVNEITQKHRDTLLLSCTQWNNKYGIKSKNLYYTTKKTFSKYLQDQNL
jgi:hypothetical protein